VPPARQVILLVEDDVSVRQLYRLALELRGFNVQVAGDGAAALQIIEDGPHPQLVLLDLGLPRVSGLNVAEEIAAHPATRAIPVIIVTGSPDPVDERRFARVLRKPIAPEDLAEAVQQCLRFGAAGSGIAG
jgi:CheY-like chemotaxis protein